VAGDCCRGARGSHVPTVARSGARSEARREARESFLFGDPRTRSRRPSYGYGARQQPAAGPPIRSSPIQSVDYCTPLLGDWNLSRVNFERRKLHCMICVQHYISSTGAVGLMITDVASKDTRHVTIVGALGAGELAQLNTCPLARSCDVHVYITMSILCWRVQWTSTTLDSCANCRATSCYRIRPMKKLPTEVATAWHSQVSPPRKTKPKKKKRAKLEAEQLGSRSVHVESAPPEC